MTQTNLNEKMTELTPEQAMDLNSKYIKIETNILKKITITNWRWTSKYFKNDTGDDELKGVFEADVTLEDGRKVTKVFSTASNKLMENFKNLHGLDKTKEYAITIMRKGSGKNTTYEVRQVI